MSSSNEQLVCAKFCFRLGKTFSETYEMLRTVFEDKTTSRTTAYEWFKRFKEGQMCIDDICLDMPSTSIDKEAVEEVKTIICSDRRLTVQEVAEQCGMSVGTCHTIITGILNMHRIAWKFVPVLLTEEQREFRIATSQEFVYRAYNDDYFLRSIVTGDAYNIETSKQSPQLILKSYRHRKIGHVYPHFETVMIFFDCRGIVHYEFVPGARTAEEHYLETLRNLHVSVKQKRPELWYGRQWWLYHDLSLGHLSLVQSYVTNTQATIIPQPPCSPDLVPADFFLFPKIQSLVQGRKFNSVEEIKAQVLRTLEMLPEQMFEECFEDWKKRCGRCIEINGGYLESG